MSGVSIDSAWAEYQGDLARDVPQRVRVLLKRAFYAGAMFGAAATKDGQERRDALMSEAVAFGRTIGTAAEAA